MANEIQITGSLAVNKSGVSISTGQFSKSIDMAGDDVIQATQAIGTTAEALNLGELASMGYLIVKNLDDTNFVDIALDASAANVISRLQPGEFCLVKPTSATLYAKANTDVVNVLVAAAEA